MVSTNVNNITQKHMQLLLYIQHKTSQGLDIHNIMEDIET